MPGKNKENRYIKMRIGKVVCTRLIVVARSSRKAKRGGNFNQSVKSVRKKKNRGCRPLVLGAATHVRAGLKDFGRRLILEPLEVLHEELAELLDLLLEVRSAVPRLLRVEKLVGNAGTGLGNG
jgi:hypothetical protein